MLLQRGPLHRVHRLLLPVLRLRVVVGEHVGHATVEAGAALAGHLDVVSGVD